MSFLLLHTDSHVIAVVVTDHTTKDTTSVVVDRFTVAVEVASPFAFGADTRSVAAQPPPPVQR